ncbi:hypothetical protein FH972_024841 [Carpinus fangiana]|uniref:Uncharacterized protein n=1 Tax=Carpinus fangiana TaxID=176857 RepID=A0A5N6KZ90_9ROSI|nr:hypothetical protein FH972_024841 [Carpinus fangiana]
MSAAIDGIGIISGILGIIGFFQDNIPSNPAPQGATIQVKAGLGDDSSNSLGGEIAHIYGFDVNNNYLGESGSGSMGDGGVVELVIDQTVPGVQSDYISVENTIGATCIAWISVVQFDGAPGSGGSWTGDIGYNCGQNWYYGNQIAGTLPDDGGDYRPYCSWLDADHTNDIKSASMKIHLRAYGEEAEDTIANNKACSSTIFSADAGPINDQPAKRSNKARKQWMQDKLIMSASANQTAEHLCSHPNSWGPDFIGTDGMFCDMEAKVLTPLCSTEVIDGCIEVDATALTVLKRSSVAKRSVAAIHREYKRIEQW